MTPRSAGVVRAWGTAAFAVALLAGCAAVPVQEKGAAAEIRGHRARCDELLGAARVDAVIHALGEGKVTVLARDEPVSELAEAIGAGVRGWQPGRWLPSNPGRAQCSVSAQTTHELRSFEVAVFWSDFSLQQIAAGEPKDLYRPMEHGLHAHLAGGGNYLGLVLPCRVSGMPSAQEQAVPLEVAVQFREVEKLDARLQGEVVAHAARQMVKHIPCENRPRIPDSLG